jgi:hypothetical protein
MGFYAKISQDSIVENILYVDPDSDEHAAIYLEQVLGLEGPWVDARPAPNSLNHANIGYTFIEDLNIFMPPKRFNSWVLRQHPESLNYYWRAPVDSPDDGKYYEWDEDSLGWVEKPASE